MFVSPFPRQTTLAFLGNHLLFLCFLSVFRARGKKKREENKDKHESRHGGASRQWSDVWRGQKKGRGGWQQTPVDSRPSAAALGLWFFSSYHIDFSLVRFPLEALRHLLAPPYFTSDSSSSRLFSAFIHHCSPLTSHSLPTPCSSFTPLAALLTRVLTSPGCFSHYQSSLCIAHHRSREINTGHPAGWTWRPSSLFNFKLISFYDWTGFGGAIFLRYLRASRIQLA